MQTWSKPLPLFLALLCLFSAAAYSLVLHGHHETTQLSRFLMWCPGASALITCLILNIPLNRVGFQWPSSRYLSFAYFLPFVYAAPVYVITWVTIADSFALLPFEAAMAAQYGLAQWPASGTFGVALPLLFTINIVSTITWALGEELGWRGFLFPLLMEKVGFNASCLITGLLWAAWHYPGLLWADYNAGTDPRFAIGCFTVMVIAMSFIMGFLRLRSASVWPCVLFHAAHNTFIQGIFDPVTASIGWSRYITSEFGIGLAVTMLLTAWAILHLNSYSKQPSSITPSLSRQRSESHLN